MVCCCCCRCCSCCCTGPVNIFAAEEHFLVAFCLLAINRSREVWFGCCQFSSQLCSGFGILLLLLLEKIRLFQVTKLLVRPCEMSRYLFYIFFGICLVQLFAFAFFNGFFGPPRFFWAVIPFLLMAAFTSLLLQCISKL